MNPTYKAHDFFGIGGEIISDNLTDALHEAGLDFTVSQHQNIVVDRESQFELSQTEDGRPCLILSKESDYNGLDFPEQLPIVRDDIKQVIGNMGRGYKVVQNSECAAILEDILRDEPEIQLVRGGHFKNCERLFLCAKLPNPIYIDEERIEKYIMVMWSHTGKAAITVRFLPTLCRADGSANFMYSDKEISIRHTKNGPKRLAEAGRVLFEARKYFDRVGDTYKKLKETPFDDEAMEDYLNILFPDPSDPESKNHSRGKRESILQIWQLETGGRTNTNKWDAFKTICQYTEEGNVRKSRKKDFSESESRLDNVWFGSGHKMKKSATKTLEEYEMESTHA